MIPTAFQYHAPRTLRDAVTLLQRYPGAARLLAGGQSLAPLMKLRLANPEHVVDLGSVDGLAYVHEADDGLHIGAMTTYAALIEAPEVRNLAPVLAEAAGLVADVQVRNRGTIGGASAHADPAADLPAVLLALEATFRVAGLRRNRHVPAHRFFVDAYTTALREGEAIAEVTVPPHPERTGGAYVKIANKASHFAVVGVAAVVSLGEKGIAERVRIGVTGAGPRAVRALAAERYASGKEATEATLRTAAGRAQRGIDYIDDLHGSAEYRRHLTGIVTLRALQKAIQRTSG